MQNYQKQATMLTFAGVVPFIIAIGLALAKVTMVEYAPYIKLYAAVVISFICGIHWAINVVNEEKGDSNLFLAAIIVALVAWVVTMFGFGRYGFVAEAVLFAYLLFVDFKLRYSGEYPSWFFKLRVASSIIVVLALGYLSYLV